jgi:hypothetical protein
VLWACLVRIEVYSLSSVFSFWASIRSLIIQAFGFISLASRVVKAIKAIITIVPILLTILCPHFILIKTVIFLVQATAESFDQAP